MLQDPEEEEEEKMKKTEETNEEEEKGKMKAKNEKQQKENQHKNDCVTAILREERKIQEERWMKIIRIHQQRYITAAAATCSTPSSSCLPPSPSSSPSPPPAPLSARPFMTLTPEYGPPPYHPHSEKGAWKDNLRALRRWSNQRQLLQQMQISPALILPFQQPDE